MQQLHTSFKIGIRQRIWILAHFKMKTFNDQYNYALIYNQLMLQISYKKNIILKWSDMVNV